MKKNKSFLGLYLIISLVFVVVSVVLALTVGINFSSDIAGGTQIEVQIADRNKVSEEIENIEQALKDNGVKAEKIFVEDKGTISNVVVRVAERGLNQDKIRADISIKTGVSLSGVSELQEYESSITKKTLIWTSVAVVCLLLALFIFGYFRYTLVGGIALMFTVLHSLILTIAMFIVTRLIVSFVALVAMLCVLALVIFATILVFEKVRESVKQKNNENADIKELVGVAKKEVFKPVIALATTLVVASLAFVFVPDRFVCLSAVATLVATIVGAYSFYFVGLSMYENLYITKKLSEKAKRSRNVSPKPSK